MQAPTEELSKRKKKKQSGQVLIEYILLLLIGLTVAKILMNGLTRMDDDPDRQGSVVRRWISIWNGIGKDFPDKDP